MLKSVILYSQEGGTQKCPECGTEEKFTCQGSGQRRPLLASLRHALFADWSRMTL